MVSISIKKLFRRCLLIAMIGVATGCASVKQMPSSTVEIQEHSLEALKRTERIVLSRTRGSAANYPPLIYTALKVPDENFVLEISVTDGKLSDYIATRFKLSPKDARQMVKLANEYAHETFPKRNDILAIIAVESSYNTKASFRGCYGLMQINKKIHSKLLRKRSLFDPAVNIEIGSIILNEYFELFKRNNKAAVLSYNAGIGNYAKRRYKLEYYTKYKAELNLISKL